MRCVCFESALPAAAACWAVFGLWKMEGPVVQGLRLDVELQVYQWIEVCEDTTTCCPQGLLGLPVLIVRRGRYSWGLVQERRADGVRRIVRSLPLTGS
mmetsp:Transcript_26950/g.66434  ORF Transcript_26950/g.66434 Transcript_26950/m.66434 type:complete len:98 (-) Transcript_26950:102-395(-)